MAWFENISFQLKSHRSKAFEQPESFNFAVLAVAMTLHEKVGPGDQHGSTQNKKLMNLGGLCFPVSRDEHYPATRIDRHDEDGHGRHFCFCVFFEGCVWRNKKDKKVRK